MPKLNRRDVRIHRSHAEADDHGYMPGTPEERILAVWDLRRKFGSFCGKPMLNEDYKDMLRCLLEEHVKFLLVGAYALAVHGYPRATKDIDFFVQATPDNASNLMKALRQFGAPLSEVSEADFSSEGIIFQIGNSPRRIDIITRISGVHPSSRGECTSASVSTPCTTAYHHISLV